MEDFYTVAADMARAAPGSSPFTSIRPDSLQETRKQPAPAQAGFPSRTQAVSYAGDVGMVRRTGLVCALLDPDTIEVVREPKESLPKRELAEPREIRERVAGAFCI